jgi:hypothetical protein
METAVMKSNRINSLLGSAILSSTIAVGLFASTASAKAQNSPRVTVSIPFAFQMGSTQMPAGAYDMHVRLSHTVVQLQDEGSGKQAVGILLGSALEGGNIQRTGRLIFHRYGNRYFLREVWDADSGLGVGSAPSGAEMKILRHKETVAQTQLAFNTDPRR